ncbi:MAG: VWA domain-containing protein [bacterium]|nr:VWA domain-containing protein [bacterium]
MIHSSIPMTASRAPLSGRRAGIVWLVTLLLLLAAPATLGAKKNKLAEKEAQLAEQYRAWLQDVQYIISKEERALFLELVKDYQRDSFIERFWKVRDPYPRTTRNEFREGYKERLAYVHSQYHGVFDDRARILLLNGLPAASLEVKCRPYLWPTEVWFYDGSDTVGFEFFLLFYKAWGGGKFRLWEPTDGLRVLSDEPGISLENIVRRCSGDQGRAVAQAISFLSGQGGPLGAQMLLARILEQPKPPAKEWVATFSTYTTDLPAGAATFDAELSIDYPGRHLSRTILQGNVEVPISGLGVSEIGTHSSYDLMLNGEILREGKLFENFRYKYPFPVSEVRGDRLPLVFQRYLRPGTYTLIVKVEDIPGGQLHRSERQIEVPKVEVAPPPAPEAPETARLLAEANAAIRSGENTIKIAPLQGEWQTGLVRIDAMSTGDGIAKVVFLLDNQPILTKKNPPFNVEIDLGQVPRSRVVRVEAFDEGDEEVASDEKLINAGQHRFSVRLVEPRRNKTYTTSLRAQADVQVPDGEVVGKVEFYLNETLVSTLYQAPFIQPIILPEGDTVAYVRAVAYTPDDLSTEDLVFVNAPENLEEIEVDFVELYTTVLDKSKRPVDHLTQADFTVLEDGARQELMRFEQVKNLPIHAAIMLDVSASMDEGLVQAQEAALHFFQQAVTPKDRAAIVTFNDHPNLAAKFTNDVQSLAGGLAGLKAERGTALYDSLIFTLYYFNGIRGQRALLLLSDGKDESSRFEFDDALEYARRAGVAIYVIGLKLPRRDYGKLAKLAEETGGRSFLVEHASELTAVYDSIQEELRSRYLLAYQSSNTSGRKDFRAIEVALAASGLEAKTLRGYYP